MVAVVHDCAKFKYECGNYTDASEYLYFYRVLVSFYRHHYYDNWSSLPPAPCVHIQAPPGHASLMSAGWGRLSSAILVQDWDTALEELNKLRRDIDESVGYISLYVLKSSYQIHLHNYIHTLSKVWPYSSYSSELG